MYWTFIDADRLGTPRFFWASVALIFAFIGTLIYIIVRPPEYLLDSRERELDLAVLERSSGGGLTCVSTPARSWRRSISCAWSAVGTSKALRELPEALAPGLGPCPYCATVQSKKNINW